jgi:hypothetical protein
MANLVHARKTASRHADPRDGCTTAVATPYGYVRIVGRTSDGIDRFTYRFLKRPPGSWWRAASGYSGTEMCETQLLRSVSQVQVSV